MGADYDAGLELSFKLSAVLLEVAFETLKLCTPNLPRGSRPSCWSRTYRSRNLFVLVIAVLRCVALEGAVIALGSLNGGALPGA